MICSDRHISDAERFTRFVQRNPFLRYTVAFIAGILLQYYSGCGAAVWYPLFYGAFALILFSFLYHKRMRMYGDWIFAVSVSLFFVSGGALACRHYRRNIDYEWFEGKAAYRVQLLSKIKEKENTIHFKAAIARCYADSSVADVQRDVLLYVARDSAAAELKAGDCLVALAEISRPVKSVFSNFDYARYLAVNGYSGCGYVASGQWYRTGHEELGGMRQKAEALRSKLLEVYTANGITGENFAVLSSIVLGYRATMSEDVRDEFSRAGASHVLAVSGLHVGILYGLFLLFFGGMLRTRMRYVAVPAVIMMLLAYAFITGLAPSVCRAVIMFSVCLVGDMLRRQRSAYNTISISAFILLLNNPMLLFDVGFQLSYIAVLSIITFAPVMSSWFSYKSRIAYKAAQLFIVPIAANIAVMSIVVYYFHLLPLYFVLSNIVISFLAPLMIYLSLFLFIVSPLPYIGSAVAYILRMMMEVFTSGISCIADMPYSTSVIWVGFWQLALLILVVFILLWIVKCFSPKKMLAGVCMINLCFSVLCIDKVNRRNDDYLIVADGNSLAVNVVSGARNVLYATDSVSASYVLSDLWLKYSLPEPEYIEDDMMEDNVFVYAGKRYLVMKGNLFRYMYNTADRFEVDCLILGSGVFPADRLFGKFLDINTLIITPAVWEGYHAQFGQLAEKYGFDIYTVDEDGPYIVSGSSVCL